MPIDPRIALMGSQDRSDALGAYRAARTDEQTFRTNQMAMQTARDTATRNAMIRERAATVNPADRASVNQFVSMAGPDAAPYIEAWSGGDTMFNNRAEEGRAAGKYAREARGEDQGFMQRAIGAVYNDPTDANIASVAAQAVAAGIPQDQMDAYVARIVAAPVEQRRTLLANELATTAEGLALLKRFDPEFDETNLGGSIDTRQVNPLAPGYAPPPQTRRVTESPNRPVLVQDAQGNYVAVNPGTGTGAPVTMPDGSPLSGETRRAPAEDAAGDARSSAAEGLRSTLESLRGYYGALDKSGGIVSTGRGAGNNIAASAAASLPGRVIGRTLGSEDQTQRDNIASAIPLIVGSLKDLTGMSAQQMNSNVELQLFLNTVADPSQSIETVNEALNRFERYVDRVSGGGAPAGGGANLPPVGEEGARVRNRSTGVIMVSRGGRWVPE